MVPQLPQFVHGLVEHVYGIAVDVDPLAFREQFLYLFQYDEHPAVGETQCVAVAEKNALHITVCPAGVLQILYDLGHIPDAELLVLEHAAECAAVVGASDGDLHQEAVSLAGRSVYITFVSHYMRSGAFMPRRARAFLMPFFAAMVRQILATFSSSLSVRMCSS